MESKDYESILNSMPETGIYIIREDDHSLLYFNERVQTVSPQIRLGMTCHDIWTGSCINCPMLTIKDRQQERSLSYNDAFGGVVDIVATKLLWKGEVPAFIVAVTPRMEDAGYTYRQIVRLDLTGNRYDVLKSDGDVWLPETGTDDLSAGFRQLAKSPSIHPEDTERFSHFIDSSHLQSALSSGRTMLTCIYRRRQEEGFR